MTSWRRLGVCVLSLAGIVIAAAPGVAVTLLLGLEPGKATRADADRVLGQAVRVTGTEVEYAPRGGSGEAARIGRHRGALAEGRRAVTTGRRLHAWAAVAVVVAAIAPPQASTGQESAGRFPILQNGRYGYIDRSGRIVIPPTFESADRFSDGLALVTVGPDHAYVDPAGQVVIRLKFSEFNLAFRFSEGLAVVGNRGPGDAIEETLGYIDKTGKVVIPLQFDEAHAFAEGLAVASRQHSRGYIDKTGAFVIAPQFGMAADFSGGLARVGSYVQGYPREHFIDRTGRRAIRQEFKLIDDFFEGLAAVWVGERKGFIDRSGVLVIQPAPFDSVSRFSDGLAQVQSGGPMGKGGRLGFIDRTGKIAIAPQYQFAEHFSEGLCAVAIGDRWGYIDKTGRVVIPAAYRIAEPFHDGLAAVWVGNAMGYIDRSGQYVWKPSV